MKLLTIAVPCYNSEAYMDRCIHSLLAGGEDVEILIIDDGSTKDRTPEIADDYERRYPGIVRAIHQENKGHGGAVNTGIDNARGLFFKVCDSDDWFDGDAYRKVLGALESIVRGPRTVDVVFSNFVYEKENSRHRKFVMRYQKFMPQDRPFGWDALKRLDPYHYVLMHSIIYRTGLLKEVGLRLPEHTFYVDNIYAYVPFSKVNTMYYCYANLYRYYIGRPDQSVNEKVMFSRASQQERVTEAMIDYTADFSRLRLHPKQKEFMIHDMTIIMAITSTMLMRKGDEKSLEEKKALWNRLKKKDIWAYYRIRRSLIGIAVNVPGKEWRKVVDKGYRLLERIYGFE